MVAWRRRWQPVCDDRLVAAPRGRCSRARPPLRRTPSAAALVFNAYMIAYTLSPKTCHSFVGVSRSAAPAVLAAQHAGVAAASAAVLLPRLHLSLRGCHQCAGCCLLPAAAWPVAACVRCQDALGMHPPDVPLHGHVQYLDRTPVTRAPPPPPCSTSRRRLSRPTPAPSTTWTPASCQSGRECCCAALRWAGLGCGSAAPASRPPPVGPCFCAASQWLQSPPTAEALAPRRTPAFFPPAATARPPRSASFTGA